MTGVQTCALPIYVPRAVAQLIAACALLDAAAVALDHHRREGLLRTDRHRRIGVLQHRRLGRERQAVGQEPAVIRDQIRILLEAYPVAVVKTGMLYNAEIIRLTAEALQALPARRRPQLVVDPVMVATGGDPLITPDAIAAYQEILFPMATVITPNLDEAAVLLGHPLKSLADLAPAASVLHTRYGCAVLLKGGHLATAEATDLLHDADGTLTLSSPFIKGVSTHGTGCTYSSAIAANLALGLDLWAACRAAKRYITWSIRDSLTWGRGAGKVQALCQWRHRGQR